MFSETYRQEVYEIVKDEMKLHTPIQKVVVKEPIPEKENRIGIRMMLDDDDDEVFTAPIDLNSCELENYLRDPKLPFYADSDQKRVNNPLDWWKANAAKYPTLAVMAKKYLCVPATSAPVERLFSRAGLTITEKRNRLQDDVAADLIFLRANWDKFEDLTVDNSEPSHGEILEIVDIDE